MQRQNYTIESNFIYFCNEIRKNEIKLEIDLCNLIKTVDKIFLYDGFSS